MNACTDAEIRSLLARVAQVADAGTVAAYLELFTEDAVWEMPANPAVGAPAERRAGRADIGAGVRARRAAGMQGPGTATRHVVAGTAVLPAPPTTATPDPRAPDPATPDPAAPDPAAPDPAAARAAVPGSAAAGSAAAATAAAVSYWMFFADTTSAPRLVSVGRYDDELRQVAGQWLLARRTITVG
ncbi:MAG: hypothetical protein V7637_2136 [Mycobacteriales bacterium]|jgi:hypothetical protein